MLLIFSDIYSNKFVIDIYTVSLSYICSIVTSNGSSYVEHGTTISSFLLKGGNHFIFVNRKCSKAVRIRKKGEKVLNYHALHLELHLLRTVYSYANDLIGKT